MFEKTGSKNPERCDSARRIYHFYEILLVYKCFKFSSIKIIEKITMKYKIPSVDTKSKQCDRVLRYCYIRSSFSIGSINVDLERSK